MAGLGTSSFHVARAGGRQLFGMLGQPKFLLDARSFQTGRPMAVNGKRTEAMQINYRKGQQVKWCACGLSKSQPHCDGSHVSVGKSPIQFTVPETKSYMMCVCKKSNKKPYCDDTTCRKL